VPPALVEGPVAIGRGRLFMEPLRERDIPLANPGLPLVMRKKTSSTTHEWVARAGLRLRLDLTWNADSVPAQ
jgi:hypothetical protein